MKKNYILQSILFLFLFFLATIIVTAQPPQVPSMLWADQFTGSSGETCQSVAVDSLGNVYSTGWFTGTADFDPGPGSFPLTTSSGRDIFVTKLDPQGNLLWALRFGGSGSDEGSSIAVDNAGRVYVTGIFLNNFDADPGPNIVNLVSHGDFDVFAMILDTSGQYVWAGGIGGGSGDEGEDIVPLVNGSFYLAGTFADTTDFDPSANDFRLTAFGTSQVDAFIAKYNADGTLIWVRQIGGNDFDLGKAIARDLNDDVVLTGAFRDTIDLDPGTGIYPVISNGADDIYVVRLDSAGNFIWGGGFGSIFSDLANNIAVDQSGSSLITGFFSDTVDFDPGPGLYPMNAQGPFDVYVNKLDRTGNFLWARQFAGTSAGTAFGIITDGINNVYTTGWFQGSMDFDPSLSGLRILTSFGQADAYVSILDSTGSYVSAMQLGASAFDIGFSITTCGSDCFVLGGEFDGTMNFSPGWGTYNLTSSDRDAFVAKYGQLIFTGVNEQEAASRIIIYPNPATDRINWNTTDDLIATKITDIYGRTLCRLTADNINTIETGSFLKPGIYLLHFENTRGNSITKKFAVR